MGDEVDLGYETPEGFWVILRDQRVPGLDVSPVYDNISGYAAPGVTVTLVLRDSSGNVKLRTTEQTKGYTGYSSGSGYFSTEFEPDDPCAKDVDIVIGDQVEMQYGRQPTVTVQVAEVAVTSIDTASDTVRGRAPANSKVRVYAYDGYLVESAT